MNRFIQDDREDYPPHPEHYFSADAAALVDAYAHTVQQAKLQGAPVPPFPETQIEPHLDNTWGDTGKAIVNNWLGMVYRQADFSRPGFLNASNLQR